MKKFLATPLLVAADLLAMATDRRWRQAAERAVVVHVPISPGQGAC